MKIFFLEFKVTPTNVNEHFDLVEGALASCWIKDNSPQSSYAKAEFYISKEDWDIVKIESLPIEVLEEHFLERDLGKEQFCKAQKEGIAIIYSVWANDKKTTAGPIPVKSSYKFPLSDYIKTQKQLSNKGRCLHYESGIRCNEIIKAHSIQKNRSLSAIANKGHVYRISAHIGSLKRNKGRLTYKKCGINKVSTFLGFCKSHDNELFEPIDNYPLIPTDQQVLLYAYRSLCRELFIKENALELVNNQLENGINQKAIHKLLLGYKQGVSFGLDNLKRHKEDFDTSLSENSYFNIRYVIFISKQKPTIAFSGLFYPDFDFMGRMLQDLGDHTSELQLLSFCSAPIDNGWAFLFAWHEASSNVCVEFMKSLATMIHDDINSLRDYLFRLAMTNCENLAISPKWWENLTEDIKETITDRATLMADIFTITDQSYLTKGLEGISNWKFENVISNMD
jgi:hypothetical protein